LVVTIRQERAHLYHLGHEQLPEPRVLQEESFLQNEAVRWYVPDLQGCAQDLERLRDRALLREWPTYVGGRGRLKVFRSEAERAGFGDAWQRVDADGGELMAYWHQLISASATNDRPARLASSE